MTPSHVRMWKHFGFDTTVGKLVKNEGKAVYCLFKTPMPALASPQQIKR